MLWEDVAPKISKSWLKMDEVTCVTVNVSLMWSRNIFAKNMFGMLQHNLQTFYCSY